MKDHKNWTSMIEDTILINLGTADELWELKTGESLTPEEQKNLILLLK